MFLAVGSWKRFGVHCNFGLSEVCQLKFLPRKRILGLSIAFCQHHSDPYEWFEGFCCAVSHGKLGCDPQTVGHSLHWSLLCRSTSNGWQSFLASGHSFMIGWINRPDFMSSPVAGRKSGRLAVSARISEFKDYLSPLVTRWLSLAEYIDKATVLCD